MVCLPETGGQPLAGTVSIRRGRASETPATLCLLGTVSLFTGQPRTAGQPSPMLVPSRWPRRVPCRPVCWAPSWGQRSGWKADSLSASSARAGLEEGLSPQLLTPLHPPAHQRAVVIQSLGHVPLFAAPWTAAPQASLSFAISQSLLKFMSTESMMPSNHLILCCLFLFLHAIFPSIRVFFQSRLCASGGQSI